MFRIDHRSAHPELPAPAAAGEPGFFICGDPLASIAATVVTPDWANTVQEELMAPVLAAGLTPDKGNNRQLLEAIRRLAVPDGPQVQGDFMAGYALYTLPGPIRATFVLQWGVAPLGNGGSNVLRVPFDFPTPFPAPPIALVGNADGPANPQWHPINVCFDGLTATGATINADSTDPKQAIQGGRVVRWIAIGVASLALALAPAS